MDEPHVYAPGEVEARQPANRSCLAFAPFHVDLKNGQLLRGGERIPLRPKTFHVLRCLAQHPAQLVTVEDLLALVWPKTHVSRTVLRVCIRELRKALEDEPQAPRFVETVHSRGYRFIAPISHADRPIESAPPIGPSTK